MPYYTIFFSPRVMIMFFVECAIWSHRTYCDTAALGKMQCPISIMPGAQKINVNTSLPIFTRKTISYRFIFS